MMLYNLVFSIRLVRVFARVGGASRNESSLAAFLLTLALGMEQTLIQLQYVSFEKNCLAS